VPATFAASRAIRRRRWSSLSVDASGSVWSSTDAGLHFGREASGAVALNAIAMSDDGILALATGDRGSVLERAPGGAWRVVPSGVSVDLYAALITTARHYVAGDAGTLLSSADEGATWAHVPVTTSEAYGLDDL
jgi:photosystem II stability/assembly factor-like uncharacterized protein